MIIHMITAMDPNRLIGKKNELPWHYPEDFKHFKQLTTGHIVVMGYATYMSIGKALPNRRNIVLSYQAIEGIESYTSIEAMMRQLETENIQEIDIIGGVSIYTQFLDKADILHVTEIKKEHEGDMYFPQFKHLYKEIERESHKEMDFVTYARVK